MTTKIGVYSAIFGRYEVLIPASFILLKNMDWFYQFTEK